jgi:hypothetical protein
LIAEARDGRQILGVVQLACCVRKRNLLPLSPDAANSEFVGGRRWLRHEPNDPLDGRVVQGERGQLGGQGPVPGVGAIRATVSPTFGNSLKGTPMPSIGDRTWFPDG